MKKVKQLSLFKDDSLKTKYARVEKVEDGFGLGTVQEDVVVYDDNKCTKAYARFPFWNSNKPKQSDNQVVINCYKWRIIWI